MKKNNSLILSFSDIRGIDLPLVGGKGANLGEMTQAGFPIPMGFCLTTVAFQKFIQSSPKIESLYTLLDTITSDNVEKVREVGQYFRQQLLEISVPDDIAAEFKKYWQRFGTKYAYSVRSSATAEDLPDASFAGQQDTYLNIIGEADLLNAIKHCWISLFTDRAILYRHKNKFSHRDVQLAVVVQKMIASEKSGIMFTADPLTGHRHTLNIDAGFGLGETLVSGIVNPDVYQVDKKECKIIKRHISDKEIAISPKKGGGTYQKKLNKEKRTKAVLTKKQILDLAHLGCKIESHYGNPQDIEWAFSKNKLYILQTRPITSLYPIDGISSPDDSLHIYFCFGHQQMMTNAMSPLGLSTVRTFFPFGRPQNKIESNILHPDGGRLFADLTLALRNFILRKIIFALISQFDILAPKTIQEAMRRPNFRRSHGFSFSLSLIKEVFALFLRVMRSLWGQNLTNAIPKINTIIDQYVSNTKEKMHKISNGKKKIQYIIKIYSSIIHIALQWIPQFIAAEFAKRLIPRIANKTTKLSDLDAVSLGLSGNVITEMNLAVGDLADIARLSPALRESFRHLEEGSQVWEKKISHIKDEGDFQKAWKAFLHKYGCRGPSEIDIMTPRWYEEPLPLLQTIAGHLQKKSGSHHAQHQKLVQKREAAVKKVMNEASRGMLGWIKKPLLKRLIYVVEEVGGSREHHKFLFIQILRIIKETLKEVGTELTDLKKISAPHDIWFLSWPELLTIWDKGKDMKELISQRKTDLIRFQKMSPPSIITSDGETPIVQYEINNIPPNALVGNPVSRGTVEGKVRVVRDPQTEILKPGEILVATFTDPGWTPLFINASGLILEVGGIMTHGSVVAREYGIPAVVGVRNATKKLKTGQKVRIDGNRGVIKIL